MSTREFYKCKKDRLQKEESLKKWEKTRTSEYHYFLTKITVRKGNNNN